MLSPVRFNVFSLFKSVEQKFWNYFNLVLVYKKACDILYIWYGFNIWFWTSVGRLGWAANLFIAPPTPLQRFVPWDLAKKWYLASIPKSFPCISKFKVFLVFILNWGTIAGINYAFIEGVSFLGVIIDKGFQECINSSNIMSHITADTWMRHQ